MFIWKWLDQLHGGNKSQKSQRIPQQLQINNGPKVPIPFRLEETISQIMHQLGNSSDIVIRRFILGNEKMIPAALIYTDGLVSNPMIANFFKSLLSEYPSNALGLSPINIIKEQILNAGEVKETLDQTELINDLLRGATVLLIDGEKKHFL